MSELAELNTKHEKILNRVIKYFMKIFKDISVGNLEFPRRNKKNSTGI